MKKITLGVLALALFATSYQTWYAFTNRLVVHTTNDENSAVCYDGVADDYYGQCVTSANAETPQYTKKMQLLNSQK